MLDAYVAQTQRLLQNPSAPTSLYAESDLIGWINIARGQLAGEAECIRLLGTIDTVADQQAYNFSAIDTGDSAVNGIEGAINVSQAWYTVGTGRKWIAPKPWPWFSLYTFNNPVPQGSFPTTWSQYGQGAAPGATGSGNGGSFYINTPDTVYSLVLDCVCYPVALEDDTTPEAIPYLWTDAVPWYAAAYALWSAQNNARMADAERYFNTYTMFVERARKASNPSINRWMYNQAGDPAQGAKMQVQPRGGAGG